MTHVFCVVAVPSSPVKWPWEQEGGSQSTSCTGKCKEVWPSSPRPTEVGMLPSAPSTVCLQSAFPSSSCRDRQTARTDAICEECCSALLSCNKSEIAMHKKSRDDFGCCGSVVREARPKISWCFFAALNFTEMLCTPGWLGAATEGEIQFLGNASHQPSCAQPFTAACVGKQTVHPARNCSWQKAEWKECTVPRKPRNPRGDHCRYDFTFWRWLLLYFIWQDMGSKR